MEAVGRDLFEKIAVDNLSRAIDFLKFAEAKNGAVVTLSSAWAFACISLQASNLELTSWLKIALQISIPFALLATLVSLFSFDPRLAIKSKSNSKNIPNLLFFGDISRVGYKEFKELIRDYYMPDHSRSYTDKYIDDLLNQVHENSIIAIRKFRFFQISVTFLSVSILIVFIFPILGLTVRVLDLID
ncbi:Pycsar system effector family protein [Nisaea denitrificans]|uniref:Pycsar system effector family protein n=1 Tax=Nisaea denitrificans TaxID=390877 RepID=UPI000490D2D3|nr:Pycsar system effector family protein [Nisaea denitrificans]